MGLKFKAKAVVLTVGTFLGGKIHIGMDNHSGGRMTLFEKTLIVRPYILASSKV